MFFLMINLFLCNFFHNCFIFTCDISTFIFPMWFLQIIHLFFTRFFPQFIYIFPYFFHDSVIIQIIIIFETGLIHFHMFFSLVSFIITSLSFPYDLFSYTWFFFHLIWIFSHYAFPFAAFILWLCDFFFMIH